MARKIGVFAIIALFISGLIIVYLLCGGSLITTQDNPTMQVVCIGTQNDADSTLLVQPNAAVLIDTGESVDTEHILSVLKENGVTTLDYMILTHNDADHIGSAKAILEKIPTKAVIKSYNAPDNERSIELDNYIASQKIAVLMPTHTRRLTAGNMRLVIYPTLEKKYTDDNNFSLAVLASHGKVKMFFAGDALRKRGEELITMNLPKVELYHIAHHGRKNSASESLLRVLNPSHVVATAPHVDAELEKIMQELQATLYCTVPNVDKRFTSDKSQLTVAEREGNK